MITTQGCGNQGAAHSHSYSHSTPNWPLAVDTSPAQLAAPDQRLSSARQSASRMQLVLKSKSGTCSTCLWGDEVGMTKVGGR